MYSNACKECTHADCDFCSHKYDDDYEYSPCDDCRYADCDSCKYKYDR